VLLAWAAALLALLEPPLALSKRELVFLALTCGVAGLTVPTVQTPVAPS